MNAAKCSERHGFASTQGLATPTCASELSARELLYVSVMSKMRSKRSRRSKTTVDRSATTDVVTQLECAIKNPHAALIGALIGGLVPWFGRTLAHDQIPSAWSDGSRSLALVMLAVVIGCGIFSGLSVYKFGKAAFGDSKKAFGFVLALEGVMLVSHGATSAIALAVLIAINAVANGSVIALAREATNKKREATAKATATRASRRAPRSMESQASATRRAPVAPPPVPSKAIVMWDRAAIDDTVIDAEILS